MYPAPTEIYTLSLHDALPIFCSVRGFGGADDFVARCIGFAESDVLRDGDRKEKCLLQHQRDILAHRSEEHTSELQSRVDLVCRLLLEKKKKKTNKIQLTITKE